MLFTAWSDTGSCINAYLVPDNFSSTSSLDILAGGVVIKTLAPNAFNEFMKGRHETGNVGFLIDEKVIDGLAEISDLELRDASTGILVYRRTSQPVIQQSIFRLETHLLPLGRLDNAFNGRFRFWYDRIDQYTSETARNILSFHSFGSLYSSGRLLYNNFDYYIDGHQKTIVLIQDPYEELAERLLLFNKLGADANQLLNERDAMMFSPIMNLSKKLKNFDETEFRLIFGQTDTRTLLLLSEPLTRQLTCKTPDDYSARGCVGQSLALLSQFHIVGIKQNSSLFQSALAGLVGVAEADIPPILQIPTVQAVAESLRAVRWLEAMIEHDLELYQNVKEAIKSVW